MEMRRYRRLLAGLLLISIIASSPVALIDAQTSDDLTINLIFAPSVIESGSGTYHVGYLSIENRSGIPIPASGDLEVKLTSSDPTIASIPPSVVIPRGHEYVKFDVTTGNDGEAEIFVQYQGRTSSQKFRVGDLPIIVPEDSELKINLPSNLMRVNTELPLAVFLQYNGTVLKAHKDITVSFEYEKSLVVLKDDKIIIKKGEYYALTTVKTLEKVGNAFIKVSAPEFQLNTAAGIQISSTAPASVAINVFPKFIGYSEKKFDLFVNLLDSAGLPTVATDNIHLELFSNYTRLQDSLDDSIGPKGAIIKKGDFGFYERHDFTFLPPVQPTPRVNECPQYRPDKIIVGVSAQGLGISTDTLTVTEPLSDNHEKAKIKDVRVFMLDEIPNNATSIVGYQVGVIEDDDDDARATVERELDSAEIAKDSAQELVNQATDYLTTVQSNPGSTQAEINFAQQSLSAAQIVLQQASAKVANLEKILDGCIKNEHAIDDLEDGAHYPMQSNTIYSSDKLYSNLRVISSDQDNIRINNAGPLSTTSSYGVSMISSGQKASDVAVSAVLGGLASGSNNTKIVNQLKPSATKIFTPIGDGKIIFNPEGYYDLFVVSLDSAGRPTTSRDPIKYIIEPINEFAEIPPQQTFAKVEGHRWQTGGNNNMPVSTSATPIGIGSESDLKTTTDLQLVSSSPTAKLMMALDSITGIDKTSSIGVVQIIDSNGNPYPVPDDLKVILTSDKPKSIQVPTSVTVIKGSSFAEFPVTTFGVKDTAKISTNAANVFQSEAEISVVPYAAKLKIHVEPIATPLVPNQDVPVKVFVDDQYNVPVSGATVRLNTNVNGTAVPDSSTTDSTGGSTFTFRALQGNVASFTAQASKSGYEEATKTVDLDVLYVPGFEINWILYVGMGGAIAGVAIVALFFLRKPKQISEDEQEEI
ncbi:MAG TPA: hypothetical protein VD699_04865 [Nitrosopumilaceae archaeon]|nr:hypothetical protein [Nitrosopumilaceae archaeon]